MPQYYVRVKGAVLRIRTWTQLEAITGKHFDRKQSLFKAILQAFPLTEVRSYHSAIQNGWIYSNGQPAGEHYIGYWGPRIHKPRLGESL